MACAIEEDWLPCIVAQVITAMVYNASCYFMEDKLRNTARLMGGIKDGIFAVGSDCFGSIPLSLNDHLQWAFRLVIK